MEASRPVRIRSGSTASVLATVVAVVAVLLVLAVVLSAVGQLHGLLQGLADRTGPRTIDRSGPVLLQSMRDLARYDAASGTFQVIVDLEKDATFLPSTIVGSRTLFVAVGSVDSYVDFSQLAAGAITVSADRTTAQVRLPHAALDKPNLDHQRSYVFADQVGIVDRITAFFAQSPNDQAQLYQLAERKISAAAGQTGLVARAETNTRIMLQGMMRTLGYQTVTVTFG